MVIIKKKRNVEFGLLLILLIAFILVLNSNPYTQDMNNIDKPDIDWGIGVYPPPWI